MKTPRPPFLFRVVNCFRPLVLVLGCALLPEYSFGQGGIVFLTRGGGVNAPITNFFTGERLSGSDYLAQLYYGLPGIPESAMVTFADAPAHFGSGETAGYITSSSGGGVRFVDPAIVNPGENTAFQIRVWSAILGRTWDEAYANWMSRPLSQEGVGKSSVIVTPTSATAIQAPLPLLGMQGFYGWVPVPEPGIGGLASLGLTVIFCRGWFARMRKH